MNDITLVSTFVGSACWSVLAGHCIGDPGLTNSAADTAASRRVRLRTQMLTGVSETYFARASNRLRQVTPVTVKIYSCEISSQARVRALERLDPVSSATITAQRERLVLARDEQRHPINERELAQVATVEVNRMGDDGCISSRCCGVRSFTRVPSRRISNALIRTRSRRTYDAQTGNFLKICDPLRTFRNEPDF